MKSADKSRLYLAVAAFLATCAGFHVYTVAQRVGEELDTFAAYQVQLELPGHDRGSDAEKKDILR